MRFKLRKEKSPIRWMFAWLPVRATDSKNNHYIVWLEEVWRHSHTGLVTFYIKEAKSEDATGTTGSQSRD
jgi:hypothetical protein